MALGVGCFHFASLRFYRVFIQLSASLLVQVLALVYATQVHKNDGTIHRHGPRSSPCPGSDKPALTSQPSSTTQLQSTAAVPPAGVCTSTAVPSVHTSTTYTVASSLSTTATVPPVFSHPQEVGSLIKRIPKPARPACATHLSSLLNKVTTNTNDLDAWSKLLHFGANTLQKPARTGERHNLTNIIKNRLDESRPRETRPANSNSFRKKRNADDLLAAAVTAKVEDGNLKAAIKILCSDEKPATDTDATYAKLQERHPEPPSDRGPAPDHTNVTAIQVTEREVMMAIRTFPAGSAGGPDGIRPQHVLDLVTCRETGPAHVTPCHVVHVALFQLTLQGL